MKGEAKLVRTMGRVFMAVALVFGMSATVVASTEAQAFDASGFAGGLLGGMIGGAIGRQSRPVVVYQNRPVYRVVPRRVERHYVSARPKSAPPTATKSAVVDQAADPFATTKSSQPAPIPVANKP